MVVLSFCKRNTLRLKYKNDELINYYIRVYSLAFYYY